MRRVVPFVAVCAVVATLTGVLPAGAQSGSTTTTTSPAAQKLTWRKCGKLECSTLQVPVDYSQPDGEQEQASDGPVQTASAGGGHSAVSENR